MNSPFDLFGDDEWDKAKQEAIYGEVMEIIKTTDSEKLTVYHVGQISTDGDERPFLYDKITKTWSLMDSGAQVI